MVESFFLMESKSDLSDVAFLSSTKKIIFSSCAQKQCKWVTFLSVIALFVHDSVVWFMYIEISCLNIIIKREKTLWAIYFLLVLWFVRVPFDLHTTLKHKHKRCFFDVWWRRSMLENLSLSIFRLGYFTIVKRDLVNVKPFVIFNHFKCYSFYEEQRVNF